MTEIQRRIYLAEGDTPNGYRSTPIGFLPSDWEYVKLSDLSLELTETAGEKRYETVSISAGIGFVNQAEKFGKELSGKQYEKYIVLHKGDFSYNKGNSNRYPQGCIYRLNDREEAAVPNVFESFRIVEGCPEYYEQLFISGFLNHQLYRLINHGVRDDGLLNLTGTDFYSCLLPVPPLREQEKIVDILSACDKMIDKCEEKAEQYRTLKKYLLDKMFPKEGAAVPEIRFPGFNDAWEQRKLGEVTSVAPFKPYLKEAMEEGDYVVIQQGDKPVLGYADGAPFTDFERVTLFGDHTLSLYKPKSPFFVATDGLKILYSDGIEDGFYYYLLEKYKPESEGYKRHFSILKECECCFPKNKGEQLAIGEFFSNLDKTITLHQCEAEAWKNKKKALAQLLLTGIIRV